MARTRTREIDLFAEAVDAAVAALDAVGIEARFAHRTRTGQGAPHKADAVLDVTVDDRAFASWSTWCRTAPVRRPPDWSAVRHRRGTTFPLLVADRITAEGRTILIDAGWSWLDRRGQLHLRAPGVRVDLAVPTAERVTASTAGPPSPGDPASPSPTG